MPCPCRVTKGLDCVFPIRFTQCGGISLTLAMPCSDHAVLKATSQDPGTARHGMCELTSAGEGRHVGDLPAFGFFRLPRGVLGRLPEALQSQMQVASLLNCWTSSSVISGYRADFHEGHGTVGAGQRRCVACVTSWHGMGMACYV